MLLYSTMERKGSCVAPRNKGTCDSVLSKWPRAPSALRAWTRSVTSPQLLFFPDGAEATGAAADAACAAAAYMRLDAAVRRALDVIQVS